MSTEHAVYTIAFEHRIDIAKELDAEETAEVRRGVGASLQRNDEAPARKRSEGDGREGLPDRLDLRELRPRSDRARTASSVRCELVDDRDPGRT